MSDSDNAARQAPNDAAATAKGTPADRLGSWKAVASYLRRSVRTVRRWEEKEGLPIHRHHHGRGSTIFALRSEINEWIASRHVTRQTDEGVEPPESTESVQPPESTESDEPPPNVPLVPRQWKSWVVPAAAAAIVTVLLFRAAQPSPDGLRIGTDGRAAAFRVLVADIEPAGWKPAAGLRVRQQLEAAIVNAEGLALVPEARKQSILRLMERSEDSAVRGETARELSIRDGEIDLLLATRAGDRDGSTIYSLELIDITDGLLSRIASAEATAGQLEETTRELAARARDLIARDAGRIAQPRLALPKVTTASLTALRLYAHGERELRESRPEAAAALFRQALNADPTFPAAEALRQRALHAARAPAKEAWHLKPADARQATSEISLPESYLIEGIRHQLAGRTERATAAYQALASLEPDNYWAAKGLLEGCRESKPGDPCAGELVRLADLSPLDTAVAYEATRSLVFIDSTKAEDFARRTATLMAANGVEIEGSSDFLLGLFEAQRDWLNRDVLKAAMRLGVLERRLTTGGADAADPIVRDLGLMSLTLGRVAEAERWFDTLDNPLTRYEMGALSLLADDSSGLRSYLIREVDYRQPITAGLLAMAGLQGQAQRLVENLEPVWEPGDTEVTKGVLTFFDGRIDESIERLEEGLAQVRSDSSPIYFMGADVLAAAHARQGDLNAAVAALEPTAGRRTRAAAAGTGLFWIKCQSQLASLYRLAGRVSDAVVVEKELLELLRSASPDHPLSLDLRSRLGADLAG